MFLRQLLTRQYLAFLLVGGGSVLLNIFVRWLLSHSLSFPAAIAGAYVVSTLTAFLFNAVITFDVRDRVISRLLKYALVNVIGLMQVLLVSMGLLHVSEGLLPLSKGMMETGCHVVALATLTITSFFLHKKFTFK
jgi:putative flippase GtrA